MGLLNIIKDINKANALYKLNKPIELMNYNELGLELWKRLKLINKTNVIDDRSNQIIELFFKLSTGEKQLEVQSILYIFANLKSFELRKEILKRYSKYIDEDNLETFFRDIETVEQSEINSDIRVILENNIKRIQSKFRQNIELEHKETLFERKSKELEKRKRIYRGIIYAENLEKIDICDVTKHESFETFEIIYEKLSVEQKEKLIINLMYNNIWLFNDERFKKYISKISESTLKEELLKDAYKIQPILEKFGININVTINDIKSFYRKYGSFPSKYSELLREDNTVYNADELVNELQFFKDEYNMESFLSTVLNKVNTEDIKKIILNKTVDEQIRKSVLNSFLLKKNYKEKLDIFNQLEDEFRNKTSKIFTYKYIDYDNIEGENISETEYINSILSKVVDTKTYNDYVINFFDTMNIDINLVFNVLKNNPEYLNNIYFYSNSPILKFSDEQIKELYEIAPDKVRASMLKLSRRKEYTLFDFLLEEELSENEIEEYNKNIPEYIIINENNYAELIASADILTLKELLSIDKYVSSLTKEQYIDVLKKIINTATKPDINYFLYIIMPNLLNDSTLEDIKNILIELNNKDICKYIHNNYIDIELSKEELINQFLTISDIPNQSIQTKYLDYLITIYEKNELKKANDNIYSASNKEINDKVLNDIFSILEELIYDSKTSVENKYLYLSRYLANFRRYYFSDENSEGIIQKKAIEMYNYINKLSGKEKYNEFSITEKLISLSELLPYFNDEKVYDILTRLYESNHKVINTISPFLLEETVLEELDYELIEFYSRYYILDNSMQNIIQDATKLKAFINSYKRLKELKAYPEEDLLKVMYTINRSETDELDLIDLSDEQNLDKIIAFSQSSNYRKIEKFDSYEDQIKENTRDIITNPLSSRLQLLDALGKRFFNLSYREMKELVIKYGKDLNIFINKYENKESLNPEEKNELSALKTIRNLKEILNINDKKALIETFNELDKDENFEHIDFTAKIALDENVKRVFSKDYLKDLYVPKDTDKRIIDGIEVYSPKDFNMIVHVVGAYSDFKLIDKNNPEKSAVEAWNNVEDKTSHILCTSYIRNSNLSYSRDPDKDKKKKILDIIKDLFNKNKDEEKTNIVLGFSDIGINSIQMANIADIAVETSNIESQKAYRHYTFRSADNLSNCTRLIHNEVDIERRLEENKTSNIKPSYVICFDEITEESKKVADDFGIPIVFISYDEIAKQESAKLKETINNYKKSKDYRLIKEIIVQYLNNLTSLSFTRKDLVEQYFNQTEMTQTIDDIISDLIKQYQIGNKDSAIEGLSVLYNSFNVEIENFLYGTIDPAISNICDFDIRRIFS